MDWRAENDERLERLDGLLEEFFRQELGRELPPLPPSMRPASGSGVRWFEHALFGALLAACIACLMLVVYHDAASRSSPRQPHVASQATTTVTREEAPRPTLTPRYVVFDQPAGYDVRRVSSEVGELVIRQRSAWRHLVWQEPEVDTTVWMAFPVVDIEWSIAQADANAVGADNQGDRR